MLSGGIEVPRLVFSNDNKGDTKDTYEHCVEIQTP